jgi:site-specific recombinase XerD
MINITPLIKPSYIKPHSAYEEVLGNPFDLPMDLDDTSINSRDEMIHVCDYLSQHTASKVTLANYIKEMERFLQWLWRVKGRPLLKLSRKDAAEYLEFIQSPPTHWIAKGRSQVKYLPNGEPNPWWRPFTVRGEADFKPTLQSMRAAMGAVSRLYYHLIECGHTQINPFMKIKYPSLRKNEVNSAALSQEEAALISNAAAMAFSQPDKHERTLFIVMALKHMDLKITDLAPNDKGLPPRMNNFYQKNGVWYFHIKKETSERTIEVGHEAMLALARYRRHLSMSDTPAPDDASYLLPSLRPTHDKPCLQYSKQIRKLFSDVKSYK